MRRAADRLAEARQCLNFRLRRASRLVGQHYDAALRPTGLRATQFSLLVVLAHSAAISLSRAAQAMSMERSALARTLKPLERQGLLNIAIGDDRRTRIVRLTAAGQRRLQRAMPHWRRAQAEFLGRLPQRDLRALLRGLEAASSAGRLQA